MRTPALVPHPGPDRDDPGKLEHVPQLSREDDGLVGPASPVRYSDLPPALHHLAQPVVGLLQALVVADDGDVVRHHLPHLFPDLVGILRAVHLHDAILEVLPSLHRRVGAGRA